ncbi:MAG: MBL fold metallo-hydrolase [Phycisphaerae bacterium]|nr:MBL fold metallo-hydrolase [Phycisphaerae bacterium]
MIGCFCPVCTSEDSRDVRTRCSVLVEVPQGNIIIDTPPEFRLQCIAHRVTRVDAVLFTHAHADHIFGLDDIRRFCFMQSGPIPCYGSEKTIRSLQKVFSYAFSDPAETYSERPRLVPMVVSGPFSLLDRTVSPLPLAHGRDTVFGFRFGNWAYCTDCSGIPPETAEQLHGLDLLILDGLRYTPHPTHFNVDQALAQIERLGPRTAYLTHIAHEIRHAELAPRLPENVHLPYDGLQLRL